MSKRVLLIIGGGIAAYKSLELIRRLGERGIATRAILTRAGAEFVTALSVGSLTGDKVYSDLFDLTDEAEMGHIELSRSADLIVVAPATADLMGRIAQGLASDLASTALLATDKPVLIAPAMNVRMWQHPATQRNLATLRADGIQVIGPDEGAMACGEYGPGRMAEPDEIAGRVAALLAAGPQPVATQAAGPLAGRKVLITAGPTFEPIDPVRYIANRSSGRQGYAIAQAARELGAQVVLVSGPVHLPVPPGIAVIPVQTARQMLAACERELPADIAICAAAVADWRVAGEAGQKLKKEKGKPLPELKLAENPDILHAIAHRKTDRPVLVVGFAAETEKVIDHARAKLKRKGCDLIVANDVSPETGVMGGGRNTVHLVRASGVESWPEMSKTEVARKLMQHIAALHDARKTAAE